MSTVSGDGWPDPAQPGLPAGPEQDRPHILLKDGDPGRPEVAHWSAATQEWWLPGSALPKSPGWAARFRGYRSPVRSDAELRDAYELGVAAGRDAAAATIAQAQEAAVRAASCEHRAQLLQARRAGAEAMRDRAAEIAASIDPTLLAEQLRTFRSGGEPVDRWHRRLHVAAIRNLPLPGDAAEA